MIKENLQNLLVVKNNYLMCITTTKFTVAKVQADYDGSSFKMLV